MGCLKLPHNEKNEPVLRCVWKSSGHSKQSVNWYDYGARFYDASLGRWHVVDPLAEYSFDKTPYHYVSNNPVLLIDPYGLYEIPELIVYGHRPPWWKRMFRKIFGDWQGTGGGTQNSGVNEVTEGNGGEGAGIEARDENVRTMQIDDFLPMLRVPGPLNPGTLDFAKFLKKSSDIYKQIYAETTDEKIIEKSTGTTSEQSSPENQTIVKTFNKNDDSIYVKVTVWKQMFPWKSNSRSGTPDSVRVPRKDSAKTVDYYKNKTFDN